MSVVTQNKNYKIMISAGESSGDMYGAGIIRAAKAFGYQCDFFGLGGDKMQAEGFRLIAHLNNTAVMGVTEVLSSLGKILKTSSLMKKALKTELPDALLLIDSPDFNFTLAKLAHKLNIPVIYFICPQVWAWRKGRLDFLKKYVDRRALLFPFEKKFYEENHVSADLVGHPLVDLLPTKISQEMAKKEFGLKKEDKLLIIMPGSRKSIILRLAPLFLETASMLLKKYPNLQIIWPKADSIDNDLVEQLLAQAPSSVKNNLKVSNGNSHRLLMASDAALLVSGTSAVEAAFIGTPMVVAYKLSPVSWFLAKNLVKVPYASLVNLMANKEIVPEFLQDKANAENLYQALEKILSSDNKQMRQDLGEIVVSLGGSGALERVFNIIIEEIGKSHKNEGKKIF